jgi:hypothetical protein
MKAARVLRFGPPNVITNDDLRNRNPPLAIAVRIKAAGVGENRVYVLGISARCRRTICQKGA